MTGHSDIESSVLWADSELESINVEYDEIVINLTESTGMAREIKCLGYIAYQLIGFWDEIVIEGAEVLANDPLLNLADTTIKSRFDGSPPETGSSMRNRRKWETLVIHFADGASLRVVASGFIVS